MRPCAAIAVLACLAGVNPVLAQGQSPDPDQLYERSVQDRLAGRNDAAIEGARRVLEVRPRDVDARLNLALALMAAGRLDEAEAELDLVLAQTPDYADARTARDRLALMRDDRADWRLDVSTAYSDLSQDLAGWREAAVTLSRRTAGGTVSGTIEHAERFDRTDTYVEARLDRAAGRGTVYGALGGTPDADFRPEIALRAGGQVPVGARGLAATLDTGLARYAVGTVTTVQPGVEYTVPGGTVILGSRWINVWDERDTYRSGYSLRAILAIRSDIRLRAGFADAPESSDGTTVDVRSISLGAELDVTERFTLRLNGLREMRTAYDRDEVSLGFGIRF